MTTREVEHEITIDAPAPEVYRLLADVANWPRIFPPTIFASVLEERDRYPSHEQRIHIWATANGEPKSWGSRRTLKPYKLNITFRQEITSPPVAAMNGAWIIEPQGEKSCRVRLLHDYRAIDDDPADLEWIDRAVDKNSTTELAALKENVEKDQAAHEATFSFTDTVHIAGHAKEVFEFINEAGLWSERLPHVARVTLTEDSPGLQTLEMDTRAKDGSVHTTKSYRVTFPHQQIVYKQITLPPLMTLHTGIWTFTEQPDGSTEASSQHTVTLNTDNIAKLLGPQATLADAREYVQTALSTNSRATLGHAKTYAEQQS